MRRPRWLAVAAIVVVASASLCSEASLASAEPKTRTFYSADRRVQATAASSWHQTVQPAGSGLSLYTDRRYYRGPGCPKKFRSMWLFVSLYPDDPTGLPPKPTRFDGRTGAQVRAGKADDLSCGQTQQVMRYQDHEAYVYVQLIWGPDTPRNQIKGAYAVLNSMVVQPAN